MFGFFCVDDSLLSQLMRYPLKGFTQSHILRDNYTATDADSFSTVGIVLWEETPYVRFFSGMYPTSSDVASANWETNTSFSALKKDMLLVFIASSSKSFKTYYLRDAI